MQKFKRLSSVFVLLIILTLVFAGSVGAFSGCGAPAPTQTEWDIPVMVPLTGALAFQGIESKNYGYDYAASEINAAGGIRGIPIKFTEYDVGWDPAKAVQMMPLAVQDSLVLIGPSSDTDLRAAADIVMDEEIVSLAMVDPVVAAEFQPWVQTIIPSNELWVTGPVEGWLELNQDIHKVALIYHSEIPVMVEMYKFAKQVALARGLEVETIEVPMSALDMKSAAVNVFSSGADGFWITIIPDLAAQMMLELRNLGVSEGSRMFLGVALMGPALLETMGSNIEGVYYGASFNPLYDNEEFQDIMSVYAADNNGSIWPSNSIWLFYDAVYLIKEAIEEMNITGDPAKLAEERMAIRDYIQGLQGDSTFQSIRCGSVEFIDGGAAMPVWLFQMAADGSPVFIAEFSP